MRHSQTIWLAKPFGNQVLGPDTQNSLTCTGIGRRSYWRRSKLDCLLKIPLSRQVRANLLTRCHVTKQAWHIRKINITCHVTAGAASVASDNGLTTAWVKSARYQSTKLVRNTLWSRFWRSRCRCLLRFCLPVATSAHVGNQSRAVMAEDRTSMKLWGWQ